MSLSILKLSTSSNLFFEYFKIPLPRSEFPFPYYRRLFKKTPLPVLSPVKPGEHSIVGNVGDFPLEHIGTDFHAPRRPATLSTLSEPTWSELALLLSLELFPSLTKAWHSPPSALRYSQDIREPQFTFPIRQRFTIFGQ